MADEIELAQLSSNDVRLLRIVMQELNEQAKQFNAFCIENQKWHEQHHENIRAIMDATQFFANSLHNKLGVPEIALKLRQDHALFSESSKENRGTGGSGGGGGGAHEHIMKIRLDPAALDAAVRALDEKQFPQLRAESAEVLLAHVCKFLRSPVDEDFVLGAITLQELARTFGDIFAKPRNQAHSQLALRVLQASLERVHDINTSLFGTAEAKELIAFIRDTL